ncbi:GtrA family protein [Roseovarius arcticus]|uniref:GtrA family protein n=1 Tax=Roseovarius arcticus TaxID=2547404 RepID=UPI001BB207E9|nr:GtrA family protein [Roseovarius arcticus]
MYQGRHTVPPEQVDDPSHPAIRRAASAKAGCPAMIARIFRLSFVGAAATLVHLLIGITLIQAGWVPAIANAAAFALAFFVSFAGHFGYTFADGEKSIPAALLRFIAVALAGFAANEAILTGLLIRHALSPSATLAVSTALVALGKFALCRRRTSAPS